MVYYAICFICSSEKINIRKALRMCEAPSFLLIGEYRGKSGEYQMKSDDQDRKSDEYIIRSDDYLHKSGE